MGIDNQSFLDSQDNAMEYVLQINRKKSDKLHNKFDEQSSLTLEKHRLPHAVVLNTRVEIVFSQKKKALQGRRQSFNVVNRTPSEII